MAAPQDHAMRILALALTLPLAACTLHFSGDDADPAGDDNGPVDPPDDPPTTPPGSSRLIIGSQPSLVQNHGDWAQLWVNYPAMDCQAIDRYGADLAVMVDAAYDDFVTATNANEAGILILGWLSLERGADNELWRITDWVPEAGGTQPDCYHW
jgi:hypothetical protein